MKISKVTLKNCGFGGPIATFLGHPVVYIPQMSLDVYIGLFSMRGVMAVYGFFVNLFYHRHINFKADDSLSFGKIILPSTIPWSSINEHWLTNRRLT